MTPSLATIDEADSDEYEDDIEEESMAESAESDFVFDDEQDLGESSEGYTFD